MLNPLRQFSLLAHIESIIVTHHIAEELNTKKKSTHLVQIPAKTLGSFLRYIKTSLLKISTSNSNKSLLMKSNSRYQIICTFWNSCWTFILSVTDTIHRRISQEHSSRGMASQPETRIYASHSYHTSSTEVFST